MTEHVTPEGHPDHCDLCRKRAGLSSPTPKIIYEQPKPRVIGEPCTCPHCEALRAEHADEADIRTDF